MIAQFALIIFLATWINLEYQNNQYLQAYLRSSIQTSLPALLTTLPIFLGVAAIGIYAKILSGGGLRTKTRITFPTSVLGLSKQAHRTPIRANSPCYQ
jgi:hypothetical protein